MHSPILHHIIGLALTIMLSSRHYTLLPLDLFVLNVTTLFLVQKFAMSFPSLDMSFKRLPRLFFVVERNIYVFPITNFMELTSYAIANEFPNL